MENGNSVNCSCSLISLNYKSYYPPSIVKEKTRQSVHSLHSSKISLSNSRQKNTVSMKSSQFSDVALKKESKDMNELILSKFGKNSVDFSQQQEKKISKKKLGLSHSFHQNIDTKKHKFDLEITKNSVMDNSADCHVKYSMLPANPQNRVPLSQIARSQQKNNCTNSKAHISSKSNILFDNVHRKIITLKQLQFKNAQSCGLVSEESEMSMVVFDQSKSQLGKLSVLSAIARRNSQFARNEQF